MFLGLFYPTRYRVAFPSRSCNLTPKLLPCSMMGSVCPVHALYGPAPVEFVIPHRSCTVISVFGSSNDLYQVCSRYLIELFFPRARLVAFRACTHFERIREPSHPLRGLRWPEGNERFGGVSGACSKFRKL